MVKDTIRRTSAFTLIELLVVIAIIAVLAALLLPTVGTVRSMSKRVACASNQRQMMAAIMVYAADNNGFTPPAEGGSLGDIARFPHLMLMYFEYLPQDRLFSTPTSATFTVPPPARTVLWATGYLRWPNVVSCPSVDPGPASANYRWFYSVRWFTQYPAGIAAEPFNGGGSIRMSSLIQTMPYLAESCNMIDPIITGYWWNYTTASLALISAGHVNVPAVRITHRGLAVVSFPDGRTQARSASQLLGDDQVKRVWSPP